eukprot:scaffold6179_cov119-Isochrysis_galbana.AAC.1
MEASGHMALISVHQSDISTDVASLKPVPSVGHGSARRSGYDMDMLATVHAAGSSLLSLFRSCTTFDSTACRFLSHGANAAPKTN